MSIDVVIKQKGLFRKDMPLEIILGKDLHYGSFSDGLRLEPDKLGETEFTAYHPQHIGRGFSVIWNPREKSRVVLRALTPSTPEELEDFYAAVRRMTEYWTCELEVDGCRMTPDAFQKGFKDMVAFDRRALKDMAQRILSEEEEGGPITLFSAFWPLVAGPEEARRFLEEPSQYTLWLHEKQSIDAYYAKPMFFSTEKGVIGRYVLTEDTRSIFPVKPYVPFGFTDPETGRALQCDDYGVMLYSTTRDSGIGELDYSELLCRFPAEKIERYDAHHNLLQGLSLQEMEKLLP